LKITYLIPEPSSKGGMTAITKMFYQINLFDRKDTFHFNTSFTWGKSKLIRFMEFFKLQFSFILHILWHKPDAIFVMSNSYFGFYDKCIYCLVGKVFGVKTMLNHVGGEFDKFYTSNKLNTWLVNKFITFPDVLLIGSNYWENYFKSHFPNVKFYNSPNPVISSDYIMDGDYGNSDKFIISSLFRIVKEKGVYELIDVVKKATAINSKLEFVIMGGGPMLEDLKVALKQYELNNQVRVLGFVDDDIKIKEICNSDLYVMLTHFDLMPISILEAMAASKPIISTKVGGIPDLVENDVNGYLFEPKEVDLVVDKIVQLANDSSLSKKLGLASKAKIQNKYDIISVIANHRNIAENLVRK